MQGYAVGAVRQARTNAVEFDLGKTEAILFSKKQNHQGFKAKKKIKIGENQIAFN
jgi:hypothetical protein